jgi:hypothetical protein
MAALAMLALSITAALGSLVLLEVTLIEPGGPHPFIPSATLFGATYSALIWLREYVKDLR